MLLTIGWISSSHKFQFFSQSRQAVVTMATIHLFLIAEKSDSGSDNGGCYDNNSSLSYRGNLTTEQRRQSLLSQHRCLAE